MASNSIRAFTGRRRLSHAPLLWAPRPHSFPFWIFHAGPSTFQSGPSSARSKLSSQGAVMRGPSATATAAIASAAWPLATGAGLTTCGGAALVGAPASAVDGPSGTQAFVRAAARTSTPARIEGSFPITVTA